MSLGDADKHIHELDAIKYYDDMVKERNLAISTKFILKAENESLKVRLSKIEAELKALRKGEKRRRSRVQELNSTVRALRSRNKELEGLKATTDGRSLKEAEKAFLEAKGAEVKRLGGSRFQEMKEEWEKKQKNREVSSTALGYLKEILTSTSEKQMYIRQELAHTGLLNQAKKVMNEEVSKMLDAEFEKRVESGSEKRAHEKVESLKTKEWKEWYNSKIEPQLNKLTTLIRTNSLVALKGDYTVRCNKCNTDQRRTIAQAEIDGLLRTGTISAECVNPNCKEWLGTRHRFPITMRDLIKWRLEL